MLFFQNRHQLAYAATPAMNHSRTPLPVEHQVAVQQPQMFVDQIEMPDWSVQEKEERIMSNYSLPLSNLNLNLNLVLKIKEHESIEA